MTQEADIARLCAKVDYMAQSIDEIKDSQNKIWFNIDEINRDRNRGKGVLLGLFLAASGLSAAVSATFTKWFN